MVKLIPVTKANPCAVCGGNHKCSRGDDGVLMCGRCSGEVAGFVCLGKATGDQQFSLYRHVGDPMLDKNDARPRRNGPSTAQTTRNGSNGTHAGNGPTNRNVDWQAVAHDLAKNCTERGRTKLAEALGLPEWAMSCLPVGASKDADGPFWSFPEVDGDLQVIGVGRRYPGGEKKAMAGSKRGLIVPKDWREFDATTPWLLVEGASDVLAAHALGLPVIGRPSNTGGVKHLITLLNRLPDNARPMLVVVGEYDPKPDGEWPGRDGAVKTASALAAELGRGWVIRWALPPKGNKDLRAYVTSLGLPGDCSDSWSVAGEKLTSILGEQYQLPPESSSAPVLSVIDSPTFAAASYPLQWVLRRFLVKDQPAVIGGPRKCLKTSLLIALAVAIGAGLDFLGHFQAERPMRVGFFSGESGPHTIQDTARNVCRALGIELENAGVYWGFTLPQLSQDEQLAALAEIIKENGLEVVILDPLYLCLLSGGTDLQASNLFDIGPLLARVARACLDAGATPILAHHAIKRPQNPFEPMELEDLAFAGIQEFARCWVLVNRREKFEPGTGVHKLWLQAGGSASYAGLWALDVDEGVIDDDFHGRKWETVLVSGAEAVAGRKVEAEKKREDRDKGDDAKVLNALDAINEEGEVTTCTKVRNRAGMSGDKFGRVKERLIAAKLVTVETEAVGIGSKARRPAEIMRRKKDDGSG